MFIFRSLRLRSVVLSEQSHLSAGCGSYQTVLFLCSMWLGLNHRKSHWIRLQTHLEPAPAAEVMGSLLTWLCVQACQGTSAIPDSCSGGGDAGRWLSKGIGNSQVLGFHCLHQHSTHSTTPKQPNRSWWLQKGTLASICGWNCFLLCFCTRTAFLHMAELIPMIDLPHLTSQFHSWWRFWGGSPCKHQREANQVFMAPRYFIQLCFPMRGHPTGGSPLDSLFLMTFNHFVLKTVIFIAACIINSELHAHWFSNYTPFLQNKND